MWRVALFSDVESKSCLANLARPDKGNGGLIVERLKDTLFDMAVYHPCILTIILEVLQGCWHVL